MRCLCWMKQTKDTSFTGKITPGKKLTASNIAFLKSEFHRMKWLISWIVPMIRSLIAKIDMILTRTIRMPTLRLGIMTKYGYSYSSKICTRCHASFLYIKGRLMKKKNDQMLMTLGNNCVAFMFDEIWYKLNGMEIDRNRNVRITNKNYASMTTKLCLERRIQL